MSNLRSTVRNSSIYAVGTIIRRITGLVMLPIYTRYLTPADYGAVELLTLTIELVGILIGLRISQAMFRYYILADAEAEKRLVVSTVLTTVLTFSTAAALCLYLAAPTFTELLFGSKEFVYEFQLFAFTLVANAVSAVGLAYLRARRMPVVFVSIGLAMLMLQVALNIYFVVMLELHVTGVVYSALISGLVLMCGLSVYMFMQVGFGFSIELAVKLMRFVYPLVIASLGAFYVSFADKYFLRHFGTLTDVGLYALAGRVASILATVYEAFNMSWAADRFEIVKRDDAREVYERVFRFITALMLLVGAGLAMFAHDMFVVMTNEAFYSAAWIVPLLVLVMLARAFMIFGNFGAMYMEQTSVMAKAAWFKAVLATVLYLGLIPVLGVYGAAISKIVATTAEAAWVYKRSSRLYDMGLDWRPVTAMLVVAVAIVGAGLLTERGDPGAFAVRVALYAGLLALFYLMPVWRRDERAMIRGAVAGAMRRLRLR